MLEFKEWPADQGRISRYLAFERLYKGEHHKAFAARVNQQLAIAGRDGLTFLALDYPKTIVDIPADLLVGHSPVISFDQDPDLNETWTGIANRSNFDALILEAVQDGRFRGDAVFTARPIGADGQALIETKPAYSYYPELDPDNVRNVLSENLAWKREFEGRDVLRVDRYQPDQIVREGYLLTPAGKVVRPIIGAELNRLLGGGDPIIPSGVDVPPLAHFPNTRASNEFFGRSALGGGLPGLFEEIDVRLSQTSIILDKHADPKMAGPPLAVGPDGRVIGWELGYIQIEDGNQLPRHLVWDAQLIAAFKQYENLKDEIFRHAQICPILAGYVNGARYDSGRAFRMQMAPTLSLVNRTGLYLAPPLRLIVRIAVAIERKVPLATVPEPNIRWRDGLPKDLAEMAQTNSQRIAAGTLSRESAIQMEMECNRATAQGEMSRWAAEQERFGAPAQPAAPEIPTPVPAPAVAAGSEEMNA